MFDPGLMACARSLFSAPDNFESEPEETKAKNANAQTFAVIKTTKDNMLKKFSVILISWADYLDLFRSLSTNNGNITTPAKNTGTRRMYANTVFIALSRPKLATTA